MTKLKTNWKLQTLPMSVDFGEALLKQHHAAQFIALAGHHLLPEKPDDSNTAMQYLPERAMLLGNKFPNNLFLELQITELKLNLSDDNYSIKQHIRLEGKTKDQVFQELKEMLKDSGLDVSHFVNELHYELPEHPLDKGEVFSIGERKYLEENALCRSNAGLILPAIASRFKSAEPVRIWPHHFDTGTYIPFEFTRDGRVSKSMGLGWAIPDTMIDEPYYYLSIWSEDPKARLTGLKDPEGGYWIMDGWSGAVLRHSEIRKKTDPLEQFNLVNSFFMTGIDTIMERWS